MGSNDTSSQFVKKNEDSNTSSFLDEEKDFYILIKDSKGRAILYNYSNSASSDPFDGFSVPLPEAYIKVIEALIEDDPQRWTNSYTEYEFINLISGKACRFMVTKFRIIENHEVKYQYIIRNEHECTHPNEGTLRSDIGQKYLYDINYKCISSVSHDFRTPLSIIYANLQLLEYHEMQLDPDTINDAFSLSRMAVKSLLRVLDKVTVIDSINKGRLEYKPATYNLKNLSEALVKELNDAEVIPDRIRYIHDERITEVQIDEYLFVSLFTHLIFNALSYSKKNHTIRFESYLEDDDSLTFYVEDFGIGLSQEQKDALSVFFDQQSSELPENIGLGLAIAKECLLLQKGKLSINSEIGKGSVFKITLPAISK